MKFTLPPLQEITTSKQGNIFKEILRRKQIESESYKNIEQEDTSLVIKDGGNEILVLYMGSSNKGEKKYRYVIINSNFQLNKSRDQYDFSSFKWKKHPLLNIKYLEKHNKDYINKSWENAFLYKEETENSNGLRIPQIGALHALQAHWAISNETAIIVLPTGTGKTETMLSLLVLKNIKTLLIIVPTDALRDQLTNKFISLGVLSIFGIISSECENPIVGIIKHKFSTKEEVDTHFEQVNVSIATMSVLAHSPHDVQEQIAKNITHLFIDEAHHTPATTWQLFKSKFANNKIVLFTATPFRNDGKRLDGKIVFNFPLRKAQELEYFKPILFKPIIEFDRKLADEKIAETAVQQLKEDLEKNFDHILMVRVNEINRAKEILKYYEKYTQFNPIVVHSQIKPKSYLKTIISNIVSKKHRIIICVDMLGEGFDLPELKIAAFHDTKKSLAITLQIAGRFIRVKANLGQATFIANIADAEVTEDLEDLYYKDSDWNMLLPDMSLKMSLEQEDFRDFLEGFKGFPDKFPIQAIKHPLSTIIFQCTDAKWNPLNYKSGIKAIDNFEYVFSDYNSIQDVFVLILGKRTAVKWAKVQDFESVDWNIIICYFDKTTKLLYLHASNTNSYYERFVEKITSNPVLLKGQSIFRCFADINRLRLHNVGVREPMGRAMNYIMRVGSDIKTALKQAEIHKAIKSNIFGVGFENGNRTSIGCSHHGRIWSMRNNNIPTWIKWCKVVSKKITNTSIDPDIVLKGTLIPKDISKLPDSIPFSIEWPDIIYRGLIGELNIVLNNEEYPIWNCDISIRSHSKKNIEFNIELPSGKQQFSLNLFEENGVNKFAFTSLNTLYFQEGIEKRDLCDFFLQYPPLIYFVNGSFLEGNLYTEITSLLPKFDADKIIVHNWKGINIKKESQTYSKIIDSIQYSILQNLKNADRFTVLMDDDDKGEIGDIIGFTIDEKQKILNIEIYHCKYSQELIPGARLEDFYQVCGQAQKSIKWMENIDEIFKHLFKRSRQRLIKQGVDRFEIGDETQLDILRRRAKKDLKVYMNIIIVQPGLSKKKYNVEGDISKLLAVVETFLHETWNSNLALISSE